MYVCYILQSESNGRYYVGSTEDLNDRHQEQNAGEGNWRVPECNGKSFGLRDGRRLSNQQ
jgi:hypothetical protein